jgi:hypothetical protein
MVVLKQGLGGLGWACMYLGFFLEGLEDLGWASLPRSVRGRVWGWGFGKRRWGWFSCPESRREGGGWGELAGAPFSGV